MINIPISFILIGISLFFTIAKYIYPEIWIFWLNHFYLWEWNYLVYFIQLFLSNFIHWDIMHFWMNALFLYLFWYPLELLIWKNKYILFFMFIVFFNGILLTVFTSYGSNTIGISWFCMAIISYYVMELKSRNNPEYKWWITALVLNIWIWFMPWISLLWHLFGAIGGVIYYYINKDFYKEKYVWESS